MNFINTCFKNHGKPLKIQNHSTSLNIHLNRELLHQKYAFSSINAVICLQNYTNFAKVTLLMTIFSEINYYRIGKNRSIATHTQSFALVNSHTLVCLNVFRTISLPATGSCRRLIGTLQRSLLKRKVVGFDED